MRHYRSTFSKSYLLKVQVFNRDLQTVTMWRLVCLKWCTHATSMKKYIYIIDVEIIIKDYNKSVKLQLLQLCKSERLSLSKSSWRDTAVNSHLCTSIHMHFIPGCWQSLIWLPLTLFSFHIHFHQKVQGGIVHVWKVLICVYVKLAPLVSAPAHNQYIDI